MEHEVVVLKTHTPADKLKAGSNHEVSEDPSVGEVRAARDLQGAPSWPRAIVETVVIVALGVALLVAVPNLLLTRLGGLARSGRVALATVWFFGMLAGFAWLLRRLQARHLI